MPQGLVLKTGLFALMLPLMGATTATAASLDPDRPEIRQFIAETSERHGLDSTSLEKLLAQAEHQQDIIEAVTRPAEAMPWHRYRPIFMREDRIESGVSFWNEHADALTRASEQYGVPEQIIVAIIGVETSYGQHRGNHRVIDALATLGFDYPPRGEFFRSELAHYLVLADEEGFDPLTMRGSYAGAMGIPQFIASSYRHYAVDGNQDGRRDLVSSVADAVASVANYFSEHHWRDDAPVVHPARVTHNINVASLANQGRQPYTSVGELRAAGVEIDAELDDRLEATLMELEGENGTEYWVGLHNFYVITRYNHSPLYALAAWQLSQAIKDRRESNS